ncbi:hypothetical protein V3N99_06845 [Dermatophilaceae bacterium Soc4.6]
MRSIVPLNGWHFRQAAEDDHLDATFISGDNEIELTVACVHGTPSQVS